MGEDATNIEIGTYFLNGAQNKLAIQKSIDNGTTLKFKTVYPMIP